MAIRYLMKIKKAIDTLNAESATIMAGLDYGKAVRMLVLAEYIVQELREEAFRGISGLPHLKLKHSNNTQGRDLFIFEKAPEDGEAVSMPLTGRDQALEVALENLCVHQKPYIPECDGPDVPEPVGSIGKSVESA